MGKVKNKLSEKPQSSFRNIVLDSSFLSKNKKRKEKRLAKSLIEEKSNTGEFIPLKKSSLAPLNKLKNETKENGFSSSPKGKKKGSVLSTSLPIGGNKKAKINVANMSFANEVRSAKKKEDVVSVLSQPNTAKKIKNKKQKFENDSIKAKTNNDSKAMEVEETVSGKLVKPDKKKSKKATKRPAKHSTDKETDDQFEEAVGDSMDSEESEEEKIEDSEDEGFDDSEDSDFDDSDENTNVDGFMSDDGEEESDKDDEEDHVDESEEEQKPDGKLQKQNVSISKKNKVTTFAKNKKEQRTPLKPILKDTKKETSTPKTKSELAIKKVSNQEQVTQDIKISKQTKEDKVTTTSGDMNKRTVGFIRHIPEGTKEEDIKNAIVKVLKINNIDSITLHKSRKSKKLMRALVHMKNTEALESILNKKFKIGEFEFSVYKAKQEIVMKPVAFIPRVTVKIKTDSIKEIIEADVGVGHVTQFQELRIQEKSQTRNILIYFDDIESAKKAILTGEYKIEDQSVIVREAREAGIEVPILRVVISNIPEKATETALKKTLESKIGQDTVHSIAFSFRKRSFAFVVLTTEDAQQKALALGDKLTFMDTNLKVIKYIPRKPFKRGPISDNAKQRRAMKRKNQSKSSERESEPPSKKKMKNEPSNLSTKNKVKTPETKDQKANKNLKVKGEREVQNQTPVESVETSPLKQKIKKKKNVKQKKQKVKRVE